MLGSSSPGWGIDPLFVIQFSHFHQTTSNLMKTYSYVPCSDIQTRSIKWINPCQNNGSRPSAYVHWGVSAVSIAAQYAEAHARDNRRCPISGWRSQQR